MKDKAIQTEVEVQNSGEHKDSRIEDLLRVNLIHKDSRIEDLLRVNLIHKDSRIEDLLRVNLHNIINTQGQSHRRLTTGKST